MQSRGETGRQTKGQTDAQQRDDRDNKSGRDSESLQGDSQWGKYREKKAKYGIWAL